MSKNVGASRFCSRYAVVAALLAAALIWVVHASPVAGVAVVAVGAGVSSDSIDRLITAVKGLGRGEYDIDSPPDQDNELGRLWRAVENAADRLEASDHAPPHMPENRSERLRTDLYDITSDPTLDGDAKIARLLASGCDWFGLDNGVLSNIDPESGDYHIEYAVGDDFPDAGTTADLEQTFCRRAITQDDILGIYNAPEEGLSDDPGYADSGIACYFGARIDVGGELYGTFCFFDTDPTDQPFTYVDRTVLDMMGRWVSYELERSERERELRLKDRAMTGAPVGITITDTTDPDRPIVHVNDAFVTLTGYDRAAIRGRSHTVLYGADTDRETVERIESAVAAEEPATAELRSYRRDGTPFWTRTSLAPVRDESGSVTHFVHFWEDITDRVENERRLSAIVENTDNPIFIKDRNGVYQFVNEATAEVFGLDPEAIVGQTDTDLFDSESAADVRATDALVMESGRTVTRETVTTIDGEERVWLDNKYPYCNSDGEIIGLMGISKEITERKRHQRELERYERILESIDDIAFVIDSDGQLVYSNERIEDYLDVSVADIEGQPFGRLATEYVASETDRAAFDDAVRRCFESTGRREEPDRVEVSITAGDDERMFECQFSPLRDGDTVTAVIATLRDVTRRKAQAAALSSLHATARELLTVEDEQAVADRVVEAGGNVLASAAVALYRFDADENALVPAAHTPSYADRTGGAPAVAVGKGESKLWDCFVTETPTAVDDSAVAEAEWVNGPDIDGGLLVPVGDHGVFVVASPEPTVDDHERQLAETLAATTEAAFDRLESEAALRARESELQARNERLERQMRTTDLLRGIDRDLISAESRAEIERVVCEQLVSVEDIAFAWVGDKTDGAVTPRAWAGADAGDSYLDTVSLSADSTEPAACTLRTGSSTVIDSVPAQLTDEPWCEQAVTSGFGSALAVPLTVADHSHGVLAVYGTESGTFGDLECDVFGELGENVADTIEAVQARQALHTERYVQLEMTIEDPDTPLACLADETGQPVEFDGVGTASDEESRLFVTAAADPETVESALDTFVSVTEYRPVATAQDGHVFELTVTGRALPSALAKAGANPRSVRAHGNQVTAVVDVPASIEVREFVDRVRDRHGAVTLSRRRDIERPTQSRSELVQSLLARLTERQLETLRTAYFAGFFDWPRQSTGEDVAAMLGVTQPTVNRHLRLGHQALLAQLFDAGEWDE